MPQTKEELQEFRAQLTDMISSYSNLVNSLRDLACKFEDAAVDFEEDDCKDNELALIRAWDSVACKADACRDKLTETALLVVTSL